MKRKWKLYQLATLILLAVVLTSCGDKTEQVREKISTYLYEKYGEEFVVDRIGKRSANNKKFYQARIYPKSIISTPRENDSYYYASSSVGIKSFGRLDEPGDSYSYIKANDDIENYLLPKAKELFGDMIRMKVDAELEFTGDGSWWAGYKAISLQQMRDMVADRPKKTRIVLNMYVYIFDRIDDKAEKEKRREEIFQYIQYLKKEELFKYLHLRISFIDEKVLTSSYKVYKKKLDNSDKSLQIINNERVHLPPLNLRQKITLLLEKELRNMQNKDKRLEINSIHKESLEIYGKNKYLTYLNQENLHIYSVEYLINVYKRGYREAKLNGTLKNAYYKKKEDLIFLKNYEYISVELKEE